MNHFAIIRRMTQVALFCNGIGLVLVVLLERGLQNFLIGAGLFVTGLLILRAVDELEKNDA